MDKIAALSGGLSCRNSPVLALLTDGLVNTIATSDFFGCELVSSDSFLEEPSHFQPFIIVRAVVAIPFLHKFKELRVYKLQRISYATEAAKTLHSA